MDWADTAWLEFFTEMNAEHDIDAETKRLMKLAWLDGGRQAIAYSIDIIRESAPQNPVESC